MTVTIDRPLGSVHPEHNDIVYPVNYGYIKGVMAPDGKELDAYVLGVNEPVSEYTGRVIAVIHRNNDAEDKLVVAPFDADYNQAEIMEAVDFQEKFFKSGISCLHEKSCGAIIARKGAAGFEYLVLFQHRSQTWSFPKGHAIEFESELQTAVREIKEEIGLSVNMIEGFRESLTYPITDKSVKEVVLFLALSDDSLFLQEEEIAHYRWADREKASRLLVHKQYQDILLKAENALKNQECAE